MNKPWETLASEHSEADLRAIYLAENGVPLDDAKVADLVARFPTTAHTVVGYLLHISRFDSLGVKAHPRAEFTIPPVGARVTTLVDHTLVCGRVKDRLGRVFDGVLPAGTTGTVTEVRTPGVECGGYVGLVVRWDVENPAFPYRFSGVAMRWDVIDDPAVFAFSEVGS